MELLFFRPLPRPSCQQAGNKKESDYSSLSFSFRPKLDHLIKVQKKSLFGKTETLIKINLFT